jgi:hypothetical protein
MLSPYFLQLHLSLQVLVGLTYFCARYLPVANLLAEGEKRDERIECVLPEDQTRQRLDGVAVVGLEPGEIVALFNLRHKKGSKLLPRLSLI